MFSEYFLESLDVHSDISGLKKDYVIIYDYLMELLEKDKIVGPFLVKKKQRNDQLNADILLDFTKFSTIHCKDHNPFLCLTLQTKGLVNKNFKPYPFFSKDLTLISYKITQSVWNALDNGFSKIGLFVRGHRDDIYELELSPSKFKEDFVKIYAKSEDVRLKINMRILIRHSKNVQKESNQSQPYPENLIKMDWLAMVPTQRNSMFNVCMPHLENEMRVKHFKIIKVQRFLKHFFDHYKNLYHLSHHILESTINREYLLSVRGKCKQIAPVLFFTLVISQLHRFLKTRSLPYVFNSKFNLLKTLERASDLPALTEEIIEVKDKIQNMNANMDLSYEEFFNYFALQIKTDKHEVDQFGMWKCF